VVDLAHQVEFVHLEDHFYLVVIERLCLGELSPWGFVQLAHVYRLFTAALGHLAEDLLDVVLGLHSEWPALVLQLLENLHRLDRVTVYEFGAGLLVENVVKAESAAEHEMPAALGQALPELPGLGHDVVVLVALGQIEVVVVVVDCGVGLQLELPLQTLLHRNVQRDARIVLVSRVVLLVLLARQHLDQLPHSMRQTVHYSSDVNIVFVFDAGLILTLEIILQGSRILLFGSFVVELSEKLFFLELQSNEFYCIVHFE